MSCKLSKTIIIKRFYSKKKNIFFEEHVCSPPNRVFFSISIRLKNLIKLQCAFTVFYSMCYSMVSYTNCETKRSVFPESVGLPVVFFVIFWRSTEQVHFFKCCAIRTESKNMISFISRAKLFSTKKWPHCTLSQITYFYGQNYNGKRRMYFQNGQTLKFLVS